MLMHKAEKALSIIARCNEGEMYQEIERQYMCISIAMYEKYGEGCGEGCVVSTMNTSH